MNLAGKIWKDKQKRHVVETTIVEIHAKSNIILWMPIFSNNVNIDEYLQTISFFTEL